MISTLGADLAPMIVRVVPPLRKVLETREPMRVAAACVVLSHMLAQQGVGLQLTRHFWQFGQTLHLCMSKNVCVNLGYNSRVTVSLADMVSHVLDQFHASCGEPALVVLRRYTPLYTPPLKRTQSAMTKVAPKHKRLVKYTLA